MVRLDDVRKRFGDVEAVAGVSLEIRPGEFFSLLGPSGSGKSTLLGLIAGFHAVTSGRIQIDGEDVTDRPAHERGLGMVFQNYSLFPHLDVRANVGFGLRMRRHPRNEIAPRVERALRTVRLEAYASRKPAELSGGQQQRVALARALVIEPKVLLLDEPLAALDKKLRDELRGELKDVQRQTGVTTIFVTHDQDEALALSDRLAVIHEGRVVQCGTPTEIYRTPATRFVAAFLGDANFARGVCTEERDDRARLEVAGVGSLWALRGGRGPWLGETLEFYVRPEQIRVAPARGQPVFTGRVVARTYFGRSTQLAIRLPDGSTWTAHVTEDGRGGGFDVGSEVTLSVDPPAVVPLTPDPEEAP